MKAETLLPLGKLDPGLRAPEKSLDYAKIGKDARLVDDLGYHALLMEETKDDPFQVLALAASASERIKIGTSVAIAFTRSPFTLAQSAWTAQKISGGRFELGIGSQVKGHIRRRHGLDWHSPVAWMVDYVGALRAIWSSWQNQSDLEYESRHYKLNLTVPLFTPAPLEFDSIPIYIAAVNPLMCNAAARIADGVRLHPVCGEKYIREVLLPVIASEKNDKFEVCLKPLIASARNEAELGKRKETARQRLAFYLSTPAYSGAFGVYGLQDLCDEMNNLSREARWEEMSARVSDDLLEEIAIIALYPDLAEKIKDRFGPILSRIEVSIPVDDETDQEELSGILMELGI